MKLNTEVSNDRQSICNQFAKFFSSVFNPAVDSIQLNVAIYNPFIGAENEIMLPDFSFS